MEDARWWGRNLTIRRRARLPDGNDRPAGRNRNGGKAGSSGPDSGRDTPLPDDVSGGGGAGNDGRDDHGSDNDGDACDPGRGNVPRRWWSESSPQRQQSMVEGIWSWL